jgi:two-component system chemotaxis response regulator CheB
MDYPIKVFVVEDSAILRERLDRTISSIPHVTIIGCADNAPGAIEQLRHIHPHVIILDIHLRESSGYQVLQEVKSHTESP